MPWFCPTKSPRSAKWLRRALIICMCPNMSCEFNYHVSNDSSIHNPHPPPQHSSNDICVGINAFFNTYSFIHYFLHLQTNIKTLPSYACSLRRSSAMPLNSRALIIYDTDDVCKKCKNFLHRNNNIVLFFSFYIFFDAWKIEKKKRGYSKPELHRVRRPLYVSIHFFIIIIDTK